MGRQIIKQPDGKFAVWSTVADGLMAHGMTRAEVEDLFVNEAKRDALDRVRQVLDLVDSGRARDAYFQFVKPWAEALREHNHNFPDDAIKEPPHGL